MSHTGGPIAKDERQESAAAHEESIMSQAWNGHDARSVGRAGNAGRGMRRAFFLALATALTCHFGGLGRPAFAEGGKPRASAVTVSNEDIATLDRVSSAIHHVAETVKPSVVSIQTMNARPARRLS